MVVSFSRAVRVTFSSCRASQKRKILKKATFPVQSLQKPYRRRSRHETASIIASRTISTSACRRGRNGKRPALRHAECILLERLTHSSRHTHHPNHSHLNRSCPV